MAEKGGTVVADNAEEQPPAPEPQLYRSGSVTLFRYAGGKRNWRHILIASITSHREASQLVVSPFLGGGVVELQLSGLHGIRVKAYDLYQPLVNFWQIAQTHPLLLAQSAREFLLKNGPAIDRVMYERMKGMARDATINTLEQALAFYVVMKRSYAGKFGSFYHAERNRLTMHATQRLERFYNPNLCPITAADCFSILPTHRCDFLFLDPPYTETGSGYYGGGNVKFDHVRLAHWLQNEHRGGFVLIYDASPCVWDLYTWANVQRMERANDMTKTTKAVFIITHKSS
jgi:DNA adenine methylase